MNFGYQSTFIDSGKTVATPKFIDNFNNASLKQSIFNANDCDEITSIFINYPALLLRKKSMLYPEGRTSYRFKRLLRKKITIVDKTSQLDANDEKKE